MELPKSMLDLSKEQRAEQAERFAKLRTQLICSNDPNRVFMAHLLRSPCIESDMVEGLGTDGGRMLYNPAYTMDMDRIELSYQFHHVLMHIGLLHPWIKIEGLSKRRWLVAMDLAVNSLLKEIGIPTEGKLMPGRGEFPNLEPCLSVEQYYAQLDAFPNLPQIPLDILPLGHGGGNDSDEDGLTMSKSQASAMVNRALREAGKSSAGNMSHPLRKQILAATAPKIPFQRVLRRYQNRLVYGGEDWSRRSRRSAATRHFLPNSRTRDVGDILVLLDVSGSMPDETIAQAMAEIRAIFENTNAKLWVWQHDYQVISRYEFTLSTPKFDRDGCGGTSHVGPFEEIQESGLKPDLIICITDCETTYPERWNACPVLWISDRYVYEENRPPFGQLLDILI